MIRLAAVLTGACIALAPLTAIAQSSERSAPLPFGPGERAVYQVKLGPVSVGQGMIEMPGITRIGNHRTYHARFTLAGGIPFARVDNTLESWIDVDGLFSRRFRQDQKEVNFERKRTFFFDPERGTYRTDGGEEGELASREPLDDVSFLFYARTLPLEVGQTYTLDRYYREDGNPVVLKVLRRETITVPAGTFRTIVVRPVIQTRGLFGEGGEAEVYFTDDSRRLLVMMRSRVPVVGSLSLHLREYTPPEGRRGAASR